MGRHAETLVYLDLHVAEDGRHVAPGLAGLSLWLVEEAGDRAGGGAYAGARPSAPAASSRATLMI